MKPVECKSAHEETSEGQKVTFGGHKATFFASWNYPQRQGAAPTILGQVGTRLGHAEGNNVAMQQYRITVDGHYERLSD